MRLLRRSHFRQVLVLGSAVLIILAPLQVSALSSDQIDVYNSGINFFDVDSTTCSSQLTTSLLGSDPQEQTYNYFVEKGLSPIAAAGITGNAMEESSGINPTLSQYTHQDTTAAQMIAMGLLGHEPHGNGWGIVQWDPPGDIITSLQKAGTSLDSIDTLATQLGFLWEELNGNPTYFMLPQLKAATTPQQAADIFEQGFERSGNGLSARESNAEQIYQQYGTNGVTASGASAPGTDTASGCAGSGNFATSFVFYSQCDPKWAKDPFGGDNICGSGCGPTSMAMVITNLTGSAVTPDQTAAYATSTNEVDSSGGSKWSIAPDLAAHWGLHATLIGNDVAQISATLQQGGLVITSGKGGLPFTTEGHYVVIRAVTPDGNWLLGDPDTSTGHSDTQEWSPQAMVANGMEPGSTYAITE